jgi:hypothetical protein
MVAQWRPNRAQRLLAAATGHNRAPNSGTAPPPQWPMSITYCLRNSSAARWPIIEDGSGPQDEGVRSVLTT